MQRYTSIEKHIKIKQAIGETCQVHLWTNDNE